MRALDYNLDPFDAWAREPQKPITGPSPRTRHADAHIAHGLVLRAEQDVRWAEAQCPDPQRVIIGPSMARTLGIEPTTPCA